MAVDRNTLLLRQIMIAKNSLRILKNERENDKIDIAELKTILNNMRSRIIELEAKVATLESKIPG